MRQLVTQPLKGQLAAIGYPPEKINYLGLSHMHFDHVGNANDWLQKHPYIRDLHTEGGAGARAARFMERTEEHVSGCKWSRILGCPVT